MDVNSDLVLSVVLLALFFFVSEPAFILFGLMRTSEQMTLEEGHVEKKGFEKRRMRLRIYTTITITMMAILLITAYQCWQVWTAPLDYTLAEYPEEPSGSWAGAAVALAIVAVLCLPWLMILRAKLKAVRRIGRSLQ